MRSPRTGAGEPRSTAVVAVLAGAVVAVVGGLLAWSAAPAGAQQVEPAVSDLRDHDVTFEDGALSGSELAQLDETAADLQDDGGYFKVVVLSDGVTRFSDARSYGSEVLGRLGGDGRVLVMAPSEVGLATNVDSASEVDDAEQAAVDALNEGSSLATAAKDAAGELGVSGGGGGGGLGWIWVVVLVAVPLLILFLLWRAARRMRQGTEQATAEQLGTAEATVRTAVDRAANDLLELADRVDLPDAPPAAKEAFGRGAETFTAAQELLEDADTRPELERAYPRVVEANWHLDTARALLDGQPAPARPEPGELFPAVVVTRDEAASTAAAGPTGTSGTGAPVGATTAPQPHYRRSSSSPWLTAAAIAAMTMLSQRGMSQPRTRPSMDEGAFGSWMGGLPSFPSSGRSRGGWFGGGGGGGRGGRGGGGRGGGGVMTSGQRRRGMGRRA